MADPFMPTETGISMMSKNHVTAPSWRILARLQLQLVSDWVRNDLLHCKAVTQEGICTNRFSEEFVMDKVSKDMNIVASDKICLREADTTTG